MSPEMHEVRDALLWVAVACGLASSLMSAMRANYWKRIARLHENARCDAQDRVRGAREPDALLKRWMTLSLAGRGDRDQLERDTDAYFTK